MWNGSLAFGEITPDIDEDVAIGMVLGAAALFVVLFIAVAALQHATARAAPVRGRVPGMVLRHGIAPDEAAMFASWRGLLQARRRLPRSRRRHFDAVHATIARLVLLHERVPLDPDAERVLAA